LIQVEFEHSNEYCELEDLSFEALCKKKMDYEETKPDDFIYNMWKLEL
jgi:hypothetical protein